MKILATSDIHIGRKPTQFSEESFSSSASWIAIVEKAIELHVDVLVLSGDVVEQEEVWFEAYGPLTHGLEKLVNSGIKVIAVGGNHDYSVFPSLVKHNTNITILGLGDKWDYIDYKGVRFIGWSFAMKHTSFNPFNNFDKKLTNSPLTLLGLLHCDLSTMSNYAPVSLSNFESLPIPLWVLGHIHKGEVLSDKAFYCGSPYALDSSEKGAHGVWLLEGESIGSWKKPEFIQLCPYRYENITIHIEGAETIEEIRETMINSLRSFSKELSFTGTLLCSITLTGTINRSLDISILNKEELETLTIQEGECTICPHGSIIDNTTLDVDLVSLSTSPGVISLLAKKLIDEQEISIMVDEYKRIEEKSFNEPSYAMLGSHNKKKSDDEYKKLVLRAGKKLLYSMLQSMEGAK